MVTDWAKSIKPISSIHDPFLSLDLVVEAFDDPLTPDDPAAVTRRLLVSVNARGNPHHFGDRGGFRSFQPRGRGRCTPTPNEGVDPLAFGIGQDETQGPRRHSG
jgi:hypothetical protein